MQFLPLSHIWWSSGTFILEAGKGVSAPQVHQQPSELSVISHCWSLWINSQQAFMFASCRLAFTASQLWASPGVWRQLSTVSQFFAVHLQVGMHEELATVYLWTKKMCRSCANVSPMHVRRCWLLFLVKVSLILKMGIKSTREICFILRDLSAS